MTNPRRLALCALGLMLALASPASAEDALRVPASADAWGAETGDTRVVRARLVTHPHGDAAGGWVGVLFDLAPGWHLYWRNPGDSGLAPRFDWSFGAASVELDSMEWPVPQRFDDGEGLITYGYEQQVLLAAPYRHTEDAAPARVSVDVDALVCEAQCIPARLSLSRGFADPSPDATAALFERFAVRMPEPSRAPEVGLRATARAEPRADSGRVEGKLWIDACGADCRPDQLQSAVFFPSGTASLRVTSQSLWSEADGTALALALERLEEGGPARLSGVVALEFEQGPGRAFDVDLPIEIVAPARAGGPGWLGALAFGLLGGLLLNLMPCVLPVLAIKVFAVAEMAHRRRREVLVHAGAYTAGILLSLLALGVAVVALRWSGTSVGWGFQLQDPVFVAIVASVVVVFALNLFGVFEVTFDPGRLGELGPQAAGARRSFFDGLLAVVLATPCSAPFLGTAVGFAFAGGPAVILSVFLAIGLGLALPFLAIALVPGSARWLPKPGLWMIELRRALGFALLATAVWLLWIVGRASGVEAMAQLLALLVVIAFATWTFGTLQRTRGASSAALVVSTALVLFVGLDAIELEPRPAPSGPEHAGGDRVYSAGAVQETLAAGHPAFVYFTADWCLTCKVNERRVLQQPEARAALGSAGVVVFRADWTRRDEAIRRDLAALGKAGVPVYALYHPDRPSEPQVLPEILGMREFIQSVRRTADDGEDATAEG